MTAILYSITANAVIYVCAAFTGYAMAEVINE